MNIDIPLHELGPLDSEAFRPAITRLGTADEPYPEFTSEERIHLVSAIASFTINAAFVIKQEDDTGSVEVGKLADLIVLDQNLFDIEPSSMSETTVSLTLFAGEPVHGSLAHF